MTSIDAPPLLVVVGPTAAGKSALAVELALALDGEVVSADSMQVYRGFDVGTGKLGDAARRGVPHHLLDIVDPLERFSASRFVELADQAIRQVHDRGRRVIVAGGTGLYVRALLHGLFQAPPPDPAIRAEHARIRREVGLGALYAELERVDPSAASRIDPHDFVRISRALEVYEQTGSPISELQRCHGFAPARYGAVRIGLAPEREELRARIDARVDRMMADGWLEEVRGLVDRGCAEAAPMGALGYRQLLAHVQGALDLAEAVRQTKRDTWRYARRQLTWFVSEPRVAWYRDGGEVTIDAVRERLARGQGG